MRLVFCMLASTLCHTSYEVLYCVLGNEYVVVLIVVLCYLPRTLVMVMLVLFPALPASNKVRSCCFVSFWAGSDLFLERRVRSCLSALLAVYCREEVQRSLDFDLPIPGLDSFQDL